MTENEQVAVEQIDRDAAFEFYQPLGYWTPAYPQEVLKGSYDSHPIVVAFARHRTRTLEASQPQDVTKVPRGPVEPVKMPPYHFQKPDYGGGSASATPPKASQPQEAVEPFEREERYIVIKRKHLNAIQETALRAHMARLGIGTSECVVEWDALPESIGRLHLGDRLSDGERRCHWDHDVPAGHPLYWPEQISQYDDSDPCCLSHAIEQSESEQGYGALSARPIAEAVIGSDVKALVIAAREAWEVNCISGDDLDKALAPFSALVPYENEPATPPIQAAESGLPDRVEIARLIHGMCYGYEGHNPNSDPDDEDLFVADKIFAMFAKAGKPGEAGNGQR